MLYFLRELICKHEFEKIKDINFYTHVNAKMPTEKLIVYMCKKCGKVKRIKIGWGYFMNICVLRLRLGKKKKDYKFSTVSDAAIFELTFLSKEDSSNVKSEIMYEDAKETKYLLQQIARDPVKYAEKEYLKWFHPEEIIKSPGV